MYPLSVQPVSNSKVARAIKGRHHKAVSNSAIQAKGYIYIACTMCKQAPIAGTNSRHITKSEEQGTSDKGTGKGKGPWPDRHTHTHTPVVARPKATQVIRRIAGDEPTEAVSRMGKQPAAARKASSVCGQSPNLHLLDASLDSQLSSQVPLSHFMSLLRSPFLVLPSF